MATRGAFVGPGRQDRFALDVRAFVEKAKGRADTITRKLVIEMVKKVVLKSPVDTGRFRANWQTSVGAPNTSTSAAVDKSGGSAIARGTSVALQFPMGGTVWLANGLPYALPLEYGHSKQAPAGMVRLTVAEFQDTVRRLAAEVAR